MAKLEYTVIIDTPFPCRKCPVHCDTCVRSDKITIEVESPAEAGQPAQLRFRQLMSPPPPPVSGNRRRSAGKPRPASWSEYQNSKQEESFNEGIILPPLLVQLKKILDQYPDDSQILKEVVQNAEDAGAKEVKLLFDRHTYGRNPKMLHHPELSQFQGPALYAFNDGLFDEEDWKGIRMLSQSVKQADPLKVGYFGLGFKSIFHLTDLPSILSGERLGVIDPHEKYFKSTTHSWNLSKQDDLLKTLPHQFEPFLGLFGCNAQTFQDGFYDGTLFRFPLRQKPTTLSDVSYTAEKIDRLFTSFEQEAHLVLLFLRHLECIELHERNDRSQNAKLLFRVSISDDCLQEVREKRVEFLNSVRSGKWPERPLFATYPITITTTNYRQNEPLVHSYSWLVTNYFCGGNVSAIFRKLHRDTELSYPPWVGAAMPIDITPPESEENNHEDFYELTDNDGHVFCFLPLPIDQRSTTGLPVHINGFFALEQNRKHIKWPSSYQSRDDLMDKRLLWNQCLLREAIPRAYAQLIIGAINLHSAGAASKIGITLDTIYRAFPDFRKVDRKYDAILPIMYSEILKRAVVYTKAGSGEWIEPRAAVFDTLEVSNEARAVIMEVLHVSEVKVTHVPGHVFEAIRRCCHINLGKIAPQLVATSFKAAQHGLSLQWEDKMKLLKYFLKTAKYDLLDGLELLPLANGGFDCFFYNPRKADKPIYIAADKQLLDLLPGMGDDFLDWDLEPEIVQMLSRAATRGCTQLKVIDSVLLGELLPKCMPTHWLSGEKVTWRPAEFGHPPETWLETVWDYLVKHTPKDLTGVEQIPLVPVHRQGEGEDLAIDMMPLSSTAVLVVRQMDGISLGAGIEAILGKIGVSVIEELPDFIKIHPLVTKHYVFSPSYIGVLQAIHKLCMLHSQHTVAEQIMELTSDEEKRKLRELFAKISAYELTEEVYELLHKLPIFETLDGSGNQATRFVCLSEVGMAAPQETLPVGVSRPLIDINNREANHLADLLGVKQLSVVQLLIRIIFPDIEAAFYEGPDVEKLMLYVLRHYYTFRDQDLDMPGILANLPFLPKRDMLLTPNRFYDPDNELLQNMFFGENNFPDGAYSDPSIVVILREIGLRGPDAVEPEDLMEAAYRVEDMVAKGDTPYERLAEKSDAILEYVQRHEEALQLECEGEPLSIKLDGVKWMRVLSAKPMFYPRTLPWMDSELPFQKPCEITDKQYANIVGSVLSVVAVEVSPAIADAFGWKKIPRTDAIIRHLGNAVKSFDGTEKASYLEISREIYKELASHSRDEVSELLGNNRLVEWIWHGDGFTSPGKVLFQEPFMDLRPFVYGLPAEMHEFVDFFADFGVRDSCSLPHVLKTIKEKYDIGNGHTKLDVKRDLHICISILNELKSTIPAMSESEFVALQDSLVLPIHAESMKHLQMAPLHECTYSDEEWLRQGYDLSDMIEEGEEKILLVHANVPTSTSEALGVPTLMSRMLDAEELDFSFGQTDSLTHRLNTLLQEYTDGFAVPKEMVQNADDAGATEVKFLYDERKNEDSMSCLIDEGMRECHGPAMWVYNNAIFTDEDFENITKLSGATKESQTDKIGRFGLGFNAVYNITDVPSFVSRHNIVIFDPHTTHLGRNIKNKLKPGIKIDIKKHRRKLKRLGNQFKPYNDIFGCDLRPDASHDSFNATLFRFPLRTKSQAIRSEICQRHYDDAEVKALLNMLVKGAESLLLFTQNVTSIGVYHIPANTRAFIEPVEVFKVKKGPVKIIRELYPMIPMPNKAVGVTPETQAFLRQSATLKASTVAMEDIRKGYKVDDVQMPNSSMIIDIERVMPRDGERLLNMSRHNERRAWLVVSYMSRGEALKMALQEEYLLPTAGVAVALEATGENDKYHPVPVTNPAENDHHNGSIFTYLPLPIHSGLPVHVNGAFAVTSNRRYLCERNEDDKFDMRAIWNETLLQDAVCNAYVNLLSDLADVTTSSYPFYSLWPRVDHLETNTRALLLAFFKRLATAHEADNLPKLFSDSSKWVSVNNALYLADDFQKSKVGGVATDVFRQCMQDTDQVVVQLPEWASAGFAECGNDAVLEKNSYDMARFFQDIFLPKVAEVDPESRDNLMLHALRSDNFVELDSAMAACACIPVTPHGEQLKAPRELIDPKSNLAVLFDERDGKFPSGFNTYASAKVLQRLQRLGMAQEDISWPTLLERAENIANVDLDKDIPTIHRQVTVLLSFMQNKLENEVSEQEKAVHEEYKGKFRDIAFLPLMRVPNSWPLAWKGEEFSFDQLMKPSEVYSGEQQDIVCCLDPVADDSLFPQASEKVKSFLGLWEKEPSIDNVLEQLSILANPETTQFLQDRAYFTELQRVCCSIYEYLENKCNKKDAREAIIRILKNKPSILAYKRFLHPRQLAANFPHNCSPYLFCLPEHYKRSYGDMMETIGVKEEFDTDDYVNALQVMHDAYTDEILSKEAMKLALLIVSLLNDTMSEHDQTLTDVVAQYGTIYIPDANGVLRLASELCFNEPDCQWVPTQDYTNYSHPLIPFAISKQLGVNTKRQEVLKKHSRGIAFGQRERLTNRLKRILSSYPCDKEILKELLQNADDAGATEIFFVKDPRHHSSERVFDDSWRPLQGPGLCVYNNKPFTEFDLEGIQKLGEGSKGCDPNKTGQYGVGFNCVYHLTDAPSFLTKGSKLGETLCIFDPHAKYVPGASLEEPGRRYDEVTELRGIFKDVFPCYLEDKFDLNEGTMFRFPLRTPEMAAESELSEQHVTLEMIDTLFSKFKMEMFDCLLFVNNIDTIGLCEVDKLTKKLTNNYTVTVDMSQADKDTRADFSHFLTEVTGKIQQGEMQVWQIPQRTATYTATLSDTRGYWEKWVITQTVGLGKGEEYPASVVEAVRRKELALLPRGGVAALLDSSDAETMHRNRRAFCFLPLPINTQLPVNINAHFALDHEARRNLWFDDDGADAKTEWNNLLLKNVIPAAYVEMLRNVPQYLGENMDGMNVSMMDFVDDSVPTIDTYGTLFPNSAKLSNYWKILGESIYSKIHSSQELVLPVVRPSDSFFSITRLNHSQMDDSMGPQAEIEWLATGGSDGNKPYFDNLDEGYKEIEDASFHVMGRRRAASTPKKKPKQDTIRSILLSSGFKLVKLPKYVYEGFVNAGIREVECVSPITVIEFYKSYSTRKPICSLGTLPCDITSTPFRKESNLKAVIDYCMQDDDFVYSNINGLPLLLCEDGQLRTYSASDPVYLTTHHELLPGLSSMFMHHELAASTFSHISVDMFEVFLRFDVHAFSTLLSNILAEYQYRKENKHVVWSGSEEETVLSPRWLHMLWSFLRSEYERMLREQVNEIQDQKLARFVLKPLNDWCLIPARVIATNPAQSQSRMYYSNDAELEATEQYLVPIGVGTTIMDYSQASIMSYPVRECLRKLGIPELNTKILDGGVMSPVGKAASATSSNSNFCKLLVATLERPKATLAALHYALQNDSLMDKLRHDDCFIILKYYNDAIEEWKADKESVDTLRQLPFYLTVQGEVTRLSSCDTYVLPNEIPNAEMDAWEKRAGIIFLKSNGALIDLFEILNCKALTVTEAYSKYIFTHFEYLSPEARAIHLKYIMNVKLPQLKGEEKEHFIEALRELRFLPDDSDILQPASQFYDPYHPVFKVMMDSVPCAFPPPPFNEFKWLDFMRIAGLTHIVSPDMFIRFATEIAAEAENPTDETFNKSRTLVTTLFKTNNLPTSGLLEQIADIRFLPAAKVNPTLQKIYPCFGENDDGRRPYISFRQGVPEGNEVLVWSSSHLLPDWANPFKIPESEAKRDYPADHRLYPFEAYQKEIASILGVPDSPTIYEVVCHTENVCSNKFGQATSDDLKAFMKVDVMKMVYKFLLGKMSGDDAMDPTNVDAIQQLGDTPCIVVDLGQTFVQPRQVVINLYEEDQIVPYLYKAPTELGEFKDLFLHLGASLIATVDQYAMVLDCVYKETNGGKLHPNEMRLAFKAVNGLFSCLQKHNEEINAEILFLPSTNARLVESTELVFNNDQAYAERIKNFGKPFLVDLAECKLNNGNHEELIKMLPKRLRPVMLTSLVTELLEDESRQTLVSYGVADKLRHQLNSRAFSNAIVRIIRHEHRRSGHKVKQGVIDAIQDQLRNVHVFAIEQLCTFLMIDGVRIDASETESECFVDNTFEDGKEIWNIFIKNSVTLNEEMLVSVAEVVNRIVGGLLRTSVHYLQPILSCAPHSISKVLDRLRIRPDHSVDVYETTLPTPGSFIPIEDHHLLKDDFEDFSPGEYVGYELDDDDAGGPTIVYSVIIEKMTIKLGENTPTPRFKQMYKVNVGEDRKSIVACNTDLYKFHRIDGFVSRNTSAAEARFSSSREPTAHKKTANDTSFYDRSSIFEPETIITGSSGEEGDVFREHKRNGNSTTAKSQVEHEQQQQFTQQQDNRYYDQYQQEQYYEPDQPQPEEYQENGYHQQDAEQEAGFQGYRTKYFIPEEERKKQKQQQKEQGGEPEPPPEQPKFKGTIPDPKTIKAEEGEDLETKVKEEVSDALEEAWKLPTKERKKIVKRILLKWHPDKNIDNEAFATSISQHIQAELERLEMGLPRPGQFENMEFQSGSTFAGSASFQKNFSNAYKFFFEQMNQRAKEHKEQRERYRENFSREYSSTNQQFDFEVPPTFSSSNPQPAQAKRFLRQAQEDLRAADNDYDGREPAYEWVCFKAHQAAEKALKAAQFSVDAMTSFSHDLASLAATLEDLELRRLAMKLQKIVGDSNKLYNPDPIDFVIIPHEEYTKEMACDAQMCSADILERVKEFVETRE